MPRRCYPSSQEWPELLDWHYPVSASCCYLRSNVVYCNRYANGTAVANEVADEEQAISALALENVCDQIAAKPRLLWQTATGKRADSCAPRSADCLWHRMGIRHIGGIDRILFTRCFATAILYTFLQLQLLCRRSCQEPP